MSFFASDEKIAVAFCSPHRKIRLPNGQTIVDTITVDWHRKRNALAVGTNINFLEWHIDGLEIGEARDLAARKTLAHRPRPEYLFFLDDDVLPLHDAFVKLFFRLQTNPQYDVAAGVYACKGLGDPLIYAGDGVGPFWDWAVGDLLTTEAHGITGTHMGLTLIRTSLFQRMLDAKVTGEDEPLFRTTRDVAVKNGAHQTRSGTEDLYFYKLAAKVGCKIIVDTSVLAGHIDKENGITHGLPNDSPPVQRAKWLGGKDRKEAEECEKCHGKGEWNEGGGPNAGGVRARCVFCNGTGKNLAPQKLALDIGAGGTRRSWPGHVTYTTDIRADAKPDYVQDTLWLNQPNDHWDLTASSHHLEHIGRWDQEKAWSEIFRITKPGGRTEHIVPSMEWAAAKIVEGCVDEHVLNVAVGAQELHQYERIYNTHFMVYTKAIAKALAEGAGFVDVVCEDWQDKPELGYNLVIRGAKPAATPAPDSTPDVATVGPQSASVNSDLPFAEPVAA